MTEILLDNNLDVDRAIDILIDGRPSKQTEKKEKGEYFIQNLKILLIIYIFLFMLSLLRRFSTWVR